MVRTMISSICWKAVRARCQVPLLVSALLAPAVTAFPAEPSLQLAELADLSIEELANVHIISTSKQGERLSDAAASVFVITADDIRRAGVTTLPEALRLAPNLQVARGTASGYTISARGFNNSAGNKLLVLIDGRIVYSPLFSGVFWDVQDVMLEDIERIEVVSGPGGTLWGTNAVNGVVNVITRAAKDTQGALIAAGGGNTEAGAAARYGAAFGDDGHYRVYGKGFDQKHTSTADGSSINDAWYKGQTGFRSDWGGAGNRFTVQGDAYGGREHQAAPGTITINGVSRLDTITVSGLNLISRWGHRLEGGSEMTLQGYYDRTVRNVPGTFDDTLDTFDVQFQHSLNPAAAHAVVWGGEYRYGMDRVINSDFVAFLPANVNQTWASLFAQDEIALNADLRFILGARVERNDYTGNEFLPNARLAWKPAPEHLLWTAASRTVRAPSRIDRDFFNPGNPPFLFAGSPDFRSEVADVYELGYRGQPVSALSYSATAFHNVYDHLRTLEIAPSGTSVVFANEMEGTTTGLEMWGKYQAAANWRLSAGATWLRENLRLKPGSAGLNGGVSAEGNDPGYTWNLRSAHTLTQMLDLDIIVRGVGALPNPSVPSYIATDIRVGWRPRRDVELSLTGRNLFGGSHAEFGNPATRSEFRPSGFLNVLWRS